MDLQIWNKKNCTLLWIIAMTIEDILRLFSQALLIIVTFVITFLGCSENSVQNVQERFVALTHFELHIYHV